MLTDDATHKTDQEAFVRTFLAENLRAAQDVSFEETAAEAVAFDLSVAWRLAIQSQETEQAGPYKGGPGTVFVEGPGALARETEMYGSTVLREAATYAFAADILTKLPDRGLYERGDVTIRTEPATFAAVIECATCKGAGKTSCRTCSGTGRINCTTCSATGMTSHGVCGGSGRVSSGSSSSGATTYQQCSCQSGKVTCSRCSGSRKLRCSSCSGDGKTMCSPCKGTGKKSTIRTLTLVAAAKRSYEFGATTSTFAREVLSRDDPSVLPANVYDGTWEAAPAIDEVGKSLTFTKHAATRFLATRVHVGEEAFEFRTYGRTLRVADGGGIVEHVLRHDKDVLAAAADAPLISLLTNPAGSFRALTKACRITLASKVNEFAFARHFGSTAGADVLGSLSTTYAEEMVESLLISFGRIDLVLSVVPWILSFVVAFLVLAIRHDRVASLFSVSAAEGAIARLPFAAPFVVGAIVTLVYFATRALPILSFADESGEPPLRSLTLARGSTYVKTTLCGAGLALVLFAIALTL